MPPQRKTLTFGKATEQGVRQTAPTPAPGPAREVVRVDPTPRPVQPAQGTVRIGVSITPTELDTARTAFLFDRAVVDDPVPSMTKWVERAVTAHLDRTPDSRKRRGAAVPAAPVERKVSYNAPIPAELRERLRRAVQEEVLAGRSISVSALVREAMAIAVEEAKDRAGGVLPVVAGPLPHGR